MRNGKNNFLALVIHLELHIQMTSYTQPLIWLEPTTHNDNYFRNGTILELLYTNHQAGVDMTEY